MLVPSLVVIVCILIAPYLLNVSEKPVRLKFLEVMQLTFAPVMQFQSLVQPVENDLIFV
jgi:hypothetical protein